LPQAELRHSHTGTLDENKRDAQIESSDIGCAVT